MVLCGVELNFPVGQVISKGELPHDFAEVAGKLFAEKFNGYVVQSVSSHFIEEGVLFFRDGEMVSCIAECLGAGKSEKGQEALAFFLNQTRGNGFYQIVLLARSQVDLVNAFDEKLLLQTKIALKDLPKLIPLTFETKFELVKKETSPLETYGLGDLR